ncbi:sigma-70 family RNA polymerase sigma factor [Dyella lipolytica]|uniref:Sigma-70 family RNA polymerase sigma factor n=2 Tax=Dyella lipolytica TaxID=1867835 RepID=A0ABW8IXS7_9GAMM
MKVTPLEAKRRVSTIANQPAIDARYWCDQMVAVATRRDVNSFMRIYDYFAPRLQRYLVGLGVNDALGQELVQEAMLRLWRRADLFDPARASLSTWLFRVARNLYIDHARSEPTWLPMQEGMEWMDEQELSTSESMTESFTDQAGLKQAIDGLSPVQARLVRMSYFEAKSHSEIAQELDMPLGSVKSHLRRAFCKLRNSMRATP